MTSACKSPLQILGLAALLSAFALPTLGWTDGDGPPHGKKSKEAREDGAEKEEKPKRRYWSARVGKAAPSFELTDLDGQSFELSEQRGKIVVLEWFNPDCPIVVQAYKDGGTLQHLGTELDGADDVVWVAINSAAPGRQGAGIERNKKAKDDFAIGFRILLDEAGWVGVMYGATTTPHMYVIDAKGKLAYKGSHGDGKGPHPVVAAVEDLRAGREVAEPETRNFGCDVKYAHRAELGQTAPAFTLVDTEGNEHSLREHLGRVVVLEWFNPDCPAVVTAYKSGGTLDGRGKQAAERGAAWFAINSAAPGLQGHGTERNQRAREQWKLDFPVLLDPTGRVGQSYGATTTPHMYVIDERGVLVYKGGHDDRKGKNFIDEALADVLAGRAVKSPETRNYGCSVKYAAPD